MREPLVDIRGSAEFSLKKKKNTSFEKTNMTRHSGDSLDLNNRSQNK